MITLFVVTYNIISTFHSFSNKYILDAKDYLSSIKKKDSVYVYDAKEFYRLYKNDSRTPQFSIKAQDNADSFWEDYITNCYFNKEVYYCVKRNKLNNENRYRTKYSFIDINSYKQKALKVCNLLTNKNKDRFYVLLHAPFSPNPGINEGQYQSFGHLKVYSPVQNCYIFQNQDKLFFFIKKAFDQNTIITYIIRTNFPNLLPLKRLQYRFDNRGFRIRECKKVDEINGFYVLEIDLPKEYPITTVKLGIKVDGIEIWDKLFYIDKI